jgi:hypothetical protein
MSYKMGISGKKNKAIGFLKNLPIFLSCTYVG